MRTLHADVITEIAKNAVTLAYLLELTLQGGSVLRYTDWETNLTIGADTYTSRGLEFPAVPHSTSLAFEPLTITVDNVDTALASAVVANDLRGGDVALKLIFLDSGGSVIGGASGPVIVYSGLCHSAKLDHNDCDIMTRSYMARLNKVVPVRNFGKTCPWVFGDADCVFDATTTKVTAQTCDAGCTTSAIADAARTEATDYWKDGILTMTSGATSGEVRRVLTSASGTITLEHALTAAPAAADTYTLQQGCDQSWNTCDTRFSNTSNFGGFVSLAEQIVKF